MRLLKAVGVLISLVVLAKVFVFPDYRHRFRLTIEFDTPDGVKSASGVHEVVRKDVRWIFFAPGAHFEYHFHGEAIFLDLGRGKHVIALLAHGPTADQTEVLSMGVETFHPGLRSIDSAVWSERPRLTGVLQLPERYIPTMVTFADLSNPTTARVVFAVDRGLGTATSFVTDNAEGELGTGYRFHQATIERVQGMWPFDILGYYGYPVSRGIEGRLPWWNQAGRPAYQAHLALKNGDRTGPGSLAEYLFKR